MRFLITGVGGFAGSHLAALLLERGHEVFGLARGHSGPRLLAALQQRFPRLSDDALTVGDVCDRATVSAVIAKNRPDGIFHLAAQSSVSSGESDPATTFALNTVGTLQVLSGARDAPHSCRVLVVSSGECYGRAAGPPRGRPPAPAGCRLPKDQGRRRRAGGAAGRGHAGSRPPASPPRPHGRGPCGPARHGP